MIAKLLTVLIRVYQLTLSKVIFALAGPVCRFEPSCSRYAMACVQTHGALRGSLLSLKRLSKCHPFHPGGFDPPPPPRRRGSPAGAVDHVGAASGPEPRAPAARNSGVAETDRLFLGAGSGPNPLPCAAREDV